MVFLFSRTQKVSIGPLSLHLSYQRISLHLVETRALALPFLCAGVGAALCFRRKAFLENLVAKTRGLCQKGSKRETNTDSSASYFFNTSWLSVNILVSIVIVVVCFFCACLAVKLLRRIERRLISKHRRNASVELTSPRPLLKPGPPDDPEDNEADLARGGLGISLVDTR